MPSTFSKGRRNDALPPPHSPAQEHPTPPPTLYLAGMSGAALGVQQRCMGQQCLILREGPSLQLILGARALGRQVVARFDTPKPRVARGHKKKRSRPAGCDSRLARNGATKDLRIDQRRLHAKQASFGLGCQLNRDFLLCPTNKWNHTVNGQNPFRTT